MSVTWNDYAEWLKPLATKETTFPSGSAPQPQQISTDTRALKGGELFVPLKGESYDAHDFIEQALSKGAAFVLCNSARFSQLSSALQTKAIAVTDTLAALQAISSGWRKKVAPKCVAAITGSVGKTTAKELTGAIFQEAGPANFPQGSFNNEIGVPLTILRTKDSSERLLLEFGARHKGDIKMLCELATPDIACVLNVKHVHVAEFGSIDGVFQTKTEMFRDSSKNAVLIAPKDDQKIFDEAKKTGKRVISFGFAKDADVSISNVTWKGVRGMLINLKTPTGALDVQLTQAHEALPFNVAAAVSIAIAANVPKEAILMGLRKYTGAKGRFQITRNEDFTIVDDSYNASPESMLSGFNSCAKIFPDASKVVVLGDMRELGTDSKKLHLDIGKKCFELLKPDLLITVGEDSKEIARGAMEAGLSKDKLFSFESVSQAQNLPSRVFTKRDLVYVKASRAMQLDKLVETLKQVDE